MATYYVSTNTGKNANSGTSAARPWATLAFALGAASGTNPGLVGGDTVYIAPGNYNEAVTIGFSSPSSTVQILGDPLNLQGFPSVTPGNVYWYNAGVCLTATSRNNITIKNIYFERQNVSLVGLSLTTCYNWTFQLCVFGTFVSLTVAQSTALNLTIDRCIWPHIYVSLRAISITGASGANYNISSVIKDCLAVGQQGLLSMDGNIGGVTVTNCTILTYDQAIRNTSNNTTDKLTVSNCLIASTTAIYAATLGTTVGDYNHRTQGGVVNVTETNTITTAQLGFDGGYARLTGFGLNDFYGSYLTSPNLGAGTATGAPAIDLYGVTWLANPDIGAVQRSALLNFQQQANPIERNSSALTIAPGETSRSLYLYLGATGITHTTTNLTASYTRNGQASVPITLVAQTPTGSYVSGGFCEVSAPYARGTYRLDVPNAAFDFGADDATIFVGGANTTNGAVVTCNMQGIAGNIVHIGPFKVIADGLGSDQPLDIVQGVQAPVSVQLVDSNENGVDISGATVEAKVYNAIGSLIATYVCVPVYAADGRCTFQLTTLVTNTAGVYNVTLTRTIGGNIIVFGPMKMIVRAN